MAGTDLVKGLSNRTRLRDLSKFYCATSQSPLLDPQDPDPDENHLGDGFIPRPPRLASDGELTALAQLAAFRLRCQRSFISIIDDRTQHIIAEATRSVSLFDENDHDTGDGLILGAQPLPIRYGVCPLTMATFLGESKVELNGSNNIANQGCVVIEDLLAEESFRGAGILGEQPPSLRYYVEVPLWTESGCLLGSICVADSETRQPGPNDVKRLQEMAKLVVQHLEWSRMKEDHRRAERLLEGLAHFVQGRDSLSDWSKTTIGQKDIPSAHPQQFPLSINSVASVPASDTDQPTNSTGSTSTAGSTTLQNELSDTSVTATTTEGRAYTPPTPIKAASSTDTDIETGFDPLQRQGSNEDVQTSTLASMSTRQAFSRASNLIRESMDLDATCFLEVPQNERFKHSITLKGSTRLESDYDPRQHAASESDSLTDSSTTEITAKDDAGAEADERAASRDVLCHRLGFATRTKSSLAGSSALQPYLTIPAALLGRLTARYPAGHIFRFDLSGSISASEDDHAQGLSPKKKSKHKTLSSRLFQHFPTARSLIFYPLYDNDKQQVYAGFLGWTTNPSRSLQKHEIVYVSGFANSIMCEVMRLQTIATDKAKSNFISSISHELRSPLHGILAATQLLFESRVLPKQTEFIQMIDVCARTLLDIMDHLLDHAKINHFTARQTKKQTNKRGRPPRPSWNLVRAESETYSLVTEVNLLSIIEETATSIAASTNQMFRQSIESVPGDARATPSIPIILDIPYSKRSTFNSEAGSWRRIIMNLVGNAIKYTQHGHISISLRFPDLLSGIARSGGRSRVENFSSEEHYAELKVTDTGQGISEEYLKHRLYTPFAQENNLSVGAGLGLSLVNQIVSSLRGEIEVHSEIGSGTEVLVRVPIEQSEHTPSQRWPDAIEDEEITSMIKDKTMVFLGFDAQPSIDEAPTGIPSPRTKALLTMKESLSKILVGWFSMYLTPAESEICVIEERHLESRLGTYDHSGNNLLIIGLDGRGSIADRISKANFVHLQPPIGPIRMAQALKQLFQNRKIMPQFEQKNISQNPLTPAAIMDEPIATSLQAVSQGIAPATGTLLAILKTSEPATNLGPDRNTINAPKSRKEAILLVDDNDINLRILVTCTNRLKLKDVEYITATNGKEALDKYIEAYDAGTKVSIVFMDISMPVMDGFASTRKIRAFEKSKGISREARSKIVALTGLGSEEHQHEIERSGFDLYLRKPVKLDMVRNVLVDERE